MASSAAGRRPTSGDAIAVPERFTLLSYMFFHGDPIHLGGNMLFLWLFGDNVEDAMGHLKFLIFYLLCGIAAGLVHALVVNGAEAPALAALADGTAVDAARSPLIGASGAVAGVIAAYLMLYPRVMVWGVAFKIFPLRITAAFALGLWIVTQIVMVMLPHDRPGRLVGPYRRTDRRGDPGPFHAPSRGQAVRKRGTCGLSGTVREAILPGWCDIAQPGQHRVPVWIECSH